MVNEIVMNVLRELEFGADLIEQGKVVNFGEIEEKTNVFLGLSLNLEECLSLFSYTSKAFVHFQICKLLKNIVIRECQTKDLDLFFYSLVHFIKNMPEIPYCVEASLIEILCLVNKLFLVKTLLCPEEQSVHLCVMAEELISSNLHFVRKRGYLVMKALISEMLNDSSNFMIGISCEKHKSIKLIFQNNNLKRMMAMCVSSLDYYCQIEDLHSLSLVSEIISVMFNLFSWTFLDVNSPSLPIWHEMSFQHNLPELLFKVLSKVRLVNPDLTVEIFQCCVALLASVKGNVKGFSTRTEFLSKMVSFALTCLSLPNINKKEIFGVTAVVQSLVTNSTSDIFLLDKLLLLKFFSVTCEITCFLCQFSIDQDGVMLEALDNLFQSWFILISNTTSQDQDVTNEIKLSAEKIFKFYLKSHIMAPEGDRSICDMLKENQVEYNNEIEDIRDEVCFSDHLFIVGMLGRFSVGENLTITLKCLFSKTEKLRECFISESELCLTSIYEDMHWILLLLAELLTDQDGVYNTIPSELIKFSHERSIASQDLSSNSSNEFVSIIHWIGMFCNLEHESHRLGFIRRFSPLLEASFLGFITRFSSSYVMYNEDMYSEVSLCLATVFGCDSEISSCMVQQLLEKVQFNLKVWSAEDQVIEKTLSLFHDISSNKEKNKICLTSATFWEVAKESLSDQYQSMTKTNKVKLLQVIFSIIPLSDKNVYIDLEEVFQMIKRNLKEITSTVTKLKISVLPECHTNLSNCLDWLTALVSSVRFLNYKKIYECFENSWTNISIISDVFHNYDEVLEDCFNIYLRASQFLLPFLQENEANNLMQSYISLINVYVKHHGRSKNSTEVLYMIQKVFKNILSAEIDMESKFNGLIANILSAIILLVTPNTFEIPEGITLFSSLLAAVAERHAEAFLYLEEEKCIRLLSLIENILSGKYNNDAVENGLDFIKLFAESLIQNRYSQFPHSHLIGQKLLEIVFQMIVNGNVNSEIYTCIGSSLCGLVVLFPQVYQRMAFEAVAKSCIGSSLSEKFIALFDILQEMGIIGNEKNRIKHLQSLKSLLFDIGRLTLKLK